jgi:hypothetical protein
MARNALPGEEQPLAELVKRGGACLYAHDHSSLQPLVPGHPQGYWLAEPVGTAIPDLAVRVSFLGVMACAAACFAR